MAEMDSALPSGDSPPADSADECIPPKKRRIWLNVQHPEVQNVDWITAMPDDILIEILSLVTIREAATTDCLSSRWRHLWENVNQLSLTARALGMQVLANSNYHENPDLWNSEATKFVHKVNELLRHHNGCGVQKFEVQFPLTSAHAPDLDRWVAFSATSGVKSLKLGLCDVDAMAALQHVEPYSLPLKHFTDVVGCKLHKLCLSNCSLETVHANLSGFSCLDCLILDSVSVVDAVVLNIMSRCSALRFLGLRKCHQLISLRASHPQLLRMGVYDCKSLISISIRAEKLKDCSYRGHKVDVQYEYAPVVHRLGALFVKKSECPLECIGEHFKLRSLTLQFPSRLQVPRVLQMGQKFAGLKIIVLCLLTSWKKCIHSVAYLLKAAPVVEKFKLEVYGNLQPLSWPKVEWPENCILGKLHTVKFGGFSGEAELLELLFFLLRRSPKLKDLLIDSHPYYYKPCGQWRRKKSEDATRCCYARGVALRHLSPEIPSTVKFRVM